MISKKLGDYIGCSSKGIHEAIDDALSQAGEHSRFEVIETTSSRNNQNNKEYQVTLSIFGE